MYRKYKIVPFCPYHFVRTILSGTILSGHRAKPSEQCAEATREANSMFGSITRTIVTRDKDAVLRL